MSTRRWMFLMIVVMIVVSLLMPGAIPTHAQSAPDCRTLGADILEFEAAFSTTQQTLYNAYIEQERTEEEAAESTRDLYQDAQWIFCENGDFTLVLFSEGEPGSELEGEWAWSERDEVYQVEATYESTAGVSFTDVTLEGVVDEAFEYGHFIRDATQILAASVNDQSFGSTKWAYADFYIAFKPWEQPARPEMTRDDAARIIASAYDKYRNIDVLTLTACRAADTWEAYAFYEYWDQVIGFWLPTDATFLIEKQSANRYRVTANQGC